MPGFLKELLKSVLQLYFHTSPFLFPSQNIMSTSHFLYFLLQNVSVTVMLIAVIIMIALDMGSVMTAIIIQQGCSVKSV